MKARHLSIPEHTRLYNSIYMEIKVMLPLDKKEADRYFLKKLLFYGVLAAASYALVYTIHNPLLFVLDYVLFGFIAVLLCFNFAHDFSHSAIFRKPFWDNLGFEFIYTLVGAHPAAWKYRHEHSHHFAPNVKGFDTDMAITGIIRLIPGSNLKWYHRFQHWYAPFAYMAYSFYWVFIKDVIVLMHSKHNNRLEKMKFYIVFVALKAVYLMYILVLPILFSGQSVQTVVLAFLLMHMLQSLYTLFTFFITHHVSDSEYPVADRDGVINTSWFMNQIRSSNDFYPFSRWANFLFGGVNNHIAHHLFPHISHYHYPAVNVILFRALRAHGIEPNVNTYFGGVWSHLRLLRRMGRESEEVQQLSRHAYS